MTMPGRNKPLPPPSPDDPLTAEGCRTARELLGWSVQRLAGASGISGQTIYVIERGAAVRQNTLSAIRTALKNAGIEFTDGDAPEVRLRRPAE